MVGQGMLRRRYAAGLVLAVMLGVLVLGLSACGGGSTLFGGAAGAADDNTVTTGGTGLPALSDLPRTAAEMTGVKRWGDEFEEALPNNNVIPGEGDVASYEPNSMTDMGEYAYAIYSFSLVETTGEATLAMDWATAPVINESTPLFWLALSNWDTGMWEWFTMDSTAELSLPDIAPYRHDETRLIYAVVMLRGFQPAVLTEIGWPDVELPPDPPDIRYVYPHGGEPGEEILMELNCLLGSIINSSELDYEWDFGDAATPSTANVVRPLITFTETPGIYDCSVRASFEYGEDVLEFKMSVGENQHWATGLFGTEDFPNCGALVQLTGAHEMVVATDLDGYYFLDHLPDGEYSVTAVDPATAPAQHNFTIDGCYASNLNFHSWNTGDSYGFGGTVFTEEGTYFSGAVMKLTGPVTKEITHGFSYGFYGLPNGDYRVTPSDEGTGLSVYFWPEYRDITLDHYNLTGQNFYAQLTPISKFTVSGTVTDADSGLPVEGLTLMLNGIWGEYVQTDENGDYEFANVPDITAIPQQWQIRPKPQNGPVTFDPISHAASTSANCTGKDFEITLTEYDFGY